MDLREIGADDPAFPEVILLYGESFPPVERKSEEAIVALLNGGSYRLYVALDGGAVAGLAALCLFPELRAASLDYLAVEPSRRGGGLGTTLFRHALAEASRHVPALRGMLLEIQREDLAGGPEERTLREARLRFYRRLGARLITRSYFLPPQSGTAPEEMYLMILPTAHQTLDRGALLELVWALHSRVYGYHRRDLLELTARRLPERVDI
jgi:GNAT superfamily N-acetyltransferase